MRQALTEVDEFGRQARLDIVEGMLKVLDAFDVLDSIVATSPDRGEAFGRLMSEPLQLTEPQAHHALDMPIGRRTRLGRAQLEAEKRSLKGGGPPGG